MSNTGESNSVFELEDLNSETQLIDENFAYENRILNTSLPNILGLNLRRAYLERSAAVYPNQDWASCEIHHGLEAPHFCRDCSLKLCIACAQASHANHDVIHRESAIDEKFDNLASSIAQFSEMISNLDTVSSKAAEVMDSMKEEKERCAKNIEVTFLTMQRQLEVLKTAMLNDLDASCAQFLEQGNERLAALQTCRQELQASENLKEDITKELLEGDRDIFAIEASVRSRLFDARSILPSLLSPKALRLSVRWNERFRNCLKENSMGGPPGTIENELYVFEPFKQTAAFQSRHPNDKKPSCLEAIALMKSAEDKKGMIAVIDSANAKVKMFTDNGRPLRCFVGGGRFNLHNPTDLVSLRGGTMLAVCDPAGNKVALFSERGVGIEHFGIGACEGLALRPILDSEETPVLEELCVLNSEARKLEILEVTSSEAEPARLRKRRLDIDLEDANIFTQPKSVVVNSVNGFIFVGDPFEHCVLLFSPEGEFVKKYGRHGCGPGELNGPAALVCDLQGQVLIADSDNHRVHQLDPCGNFVRFILTAANGIRHPQGLALDEGNAHLWVVLRSGGVKQFSYS